jgi:hypothetical protein
MLNSYQNFLEEFYDASSTESLISMGIAISNPETCSICGKENCVHVK